MNTCIVIPARMASTRLLGKPLADIGGEPMVVRVAQAASKAGFGAPMIAAGDQEIVDRVQAAGFRAILTPTDLPSGTDRVHCAVELAGLPDTIKYIVNLQGDLPSIDPTYIQKVVAALQQVPSAHIATLVTKIGSQAQKDNPDVVKAILTPIGSDSSQSQAELFRALYFTRAAAPTGSGQMYHHIGIYAYRRAALRQMTSLAPSPLEVSEKLEQLRALENKMLIIAALVNGAPIGVDSADDLARVRKSWGK